MELRSQGIPGGDPAPGGPPIGALLEAVLVGVARPGVIPCVETIQAAVGDGEGLGLPQIRRFILPNQKRMADLARSYGIHIIYHTDGAAREVIPDAVTEGKDGYLMLKADPIHWAAINAIRELNTKLEDQRAENTELKQQVADLKKLMNEFRQRLDGAVK